MPKTGKRRNEKYLPYKGIVEIVLDNNSYLGCYDEDKNTIDFAIEIDEYGVYKKDIERWIVLHNVEKYFEINLKNSQYTIRNLSAELFNYLEYCWGVMKTAKRTAINHYENTIFETILKEKE